MFICVHPWFYSEWPVKKDEFDMFYFDSIEEASFLIGFEFLRDGFWKFYVLDVELSRL